MVEIVPICLG